MTERKQLEGGPPAMVLNLAVVGLSVARSLGRAGVSVLGVEHRDLDTSNVFLSKYYSDVLQVSDPVSESADLLKELLDYGASTSNRPMLFPTADSYVFFVSEHRAALSKYFDFALPKVEMVRTIIDKEAQYNHAEKQGIPIPRTSYPESIKDVLDFSDDVKYPLFIKPRSSVKLTLSHRKGFRVNDREELIKGFELATEMGVKVMIQEIVTGGAENLFCMAGYFRNDGEPVATYSQQKLRQYPVDFGVGTMTTTVHNERVMELGLKFIKSLGFNGICQVEFKLDDRDGQFKLMEINPRPWKQIAECTAAGVNLPLLQYCDLTGIAGPPITDFVDGIRWWDGMNDFKAFWTLKERGELTWSQWLRSWMGAESNAHAARDDIRPLMKATGNGLKAAELVYGLLRSGAGDPHKPV